MHVLPPTTRSNKIHLCVMYLISKLVELFLVCGWKDIVSERWRSYHTSYFKTKWYLSGAVFGVQICISSSRWSLQFVPLRILSKGQVPLPFEYELFFEPFVIRHKRKKQKNEFTRDNIKASWTKQLDYPRRRGKTGLEFLMANFLI